MKLEELIAPFFPPTAYSSPQVCGVEGAPYFIITVTLSSAMVATGPCSMQDFLAFNTDVCLPLLLCGSVRDPSVSGQGHVCIHVPHCPGDAKVLL